MFFFCTKTGVALLSINVEKCSRANLILYTYFLFFIFKYENQEYLYRTRTVTENHTFIDVVLSR